MRKTGGTSNNSNRKPEGIPDLLPQDKMAKRAGFSSPNANSPTSCESRDVPSGNTTYAQLFTVGARGETHTMVYA